MKCRFAPSAPSRHVARQPQLNDNGQRALRTDPPGRCDRCAQMTQTSELVAFLKWPCTILLHKPEAPAKDLRWRFRLVCGRFPHGDIVRVAWYGMFITFRLPRD